MPTRTDLTRIAASLAVLGTELEHKGQRAIDTLAGWAQGPTRAAQHGERGGGGTELAAEDRRTELAQARRAAVHHAEFVADLHRIDVLVQRINRRLDMACPPDMAELRNRRTGEFEPETAADMLAAGWCPNCWLAGLGSVPLTTRANTGLRYYSDRCKPCGEFRKAEGIDMPKELVIAHHEKRRLSAPERDRIVNAAKAAANPTKKKKGKTKKSRKVA